ncbi:unnamed protein product [Coregonus sp. 'balchen']|nr:unnamed protein product [Coregonus sp. 'balchen']
MFSYRFYNKLFSFSGLSLLLEDSVYPGQAVHPIHKLLSRAPLHAQAAYSKLTCSFSLHPLLAWLRQALVLNPFGISACLRSGKKLVWAQQVSLDKCRNSTAVLAPIKTSIHIQSCENVRVVCVAGHLAIGSSSYCTIHGLNPTRTLLLPGNTALTSGPFHTLPLPGGSHGEMEGDMCEVPGRLPSMYQKAHEEREKSVQDWQKTRCQFQALVEQKFHEWLLESGHRQELDRLIPLCVTSQDPSDSDSLEARPNDTRQEETS